MWLYSQHSSEPVTADPLSKAALRADGSSLELAPGIVNAAVHCTVCACQTVDLLARLFALESRLWESLLHGSFVYACALQLDFPSNVGP